MQQKNWLGLLLFILIPGVVLAQSGKIRGTVVDEQTKEPLIGAAVTIEGTSYGSASDVDGTFQILNVPVRTYNIKASYVGYRAITITNVRVNANLTSEANFKLPGEGVNVQTVEIMAERPLINKSATNAISIVDNENIQQMPVRDLTSVFSLQAGVVQQGVDPNGNANLYIRGSRADETGFQIDGVSINNVYTGGRAIAVNQESVEQIQVQEGGYPAEYGGANGGLINMQLKTGRENMHATAQVETDNYTSQGKKSLGGYSYGYSDYVATVSGPVVSDKIRFFASVENQFYRDPTVRYWDGFNFTGSNAVITAPATTPAHSASLPDTLNLAYQPGNIKGGLQNDYTYTGTLLSDLGELQLRGSGSYHTREARNASNFNNLSNFANVLNTSRLPLRQNYDGFSNIKATWFLAPKTYIEGNFNYFASDTKTEDPIFKENFTLYADSTANAQHGITFSSDGSNFLPWKIGGGGQPTVASVNQPGTPTTGYTHTSQKSIGGRIDLFSQVGNHALKAGGEYSYYTIRRYAISGGPNNNTGINALHSSGYLADTTDIQRQAFLMSGGYVDNFGYDALGNLIDNNQYVNGNLFNLGARHPEFAAAYIQDKIELSDIVLNIGLRCDYINSDNISYVDPTNLHVIKSLGVVSKSDIVRTPGTIQISPRLGFGFPVTDRTMFHAQYGKFIQQSQLQDAYSGLGQATYYIAGGNFIETPVGYGLKPERSTQYEAGFSQQVSDNASFDITAFYKDVQDAVQYATILPSAGATIKAYPALINGDFATAKGLEFKFTIRRVKRIQMQLNYTYTNGQGTGSSSNDLAGASYNGNIPKMIFPFSYNQAHTGNLSLDYRFSQNDGGPILERLGVNLLLTFGSGYNFTQENVSGNLYGNAAELDVRNRIPIEPIGASTTNGNFELDLRIDKSVTFGPVDANFYIYVINLLNTQNIVSVFSRTGDAADDGWLASPAGQQEASGAVSPAQYAAIYQSRYLGNNVNAGTGSNGSNYGVPRQIRFGVKLEFSK